MTMTRQEFIEKFRHEIGGLVLDAATSGKTGADMSMTLRHAMRKIDAMLGKAYDDVAPKHAEPVVKVLPAAALPAPKAVGKVAGQ